MGYSFVHKVLAGSSSDENKRTEGNCKNTLWWLLLLKLPSYITIFSRKS